MPDTCNRLRGYGILYECVRVGLSGDGFGDIQYGSRGAVYQYWGAIFIFIIVARIAIRFGFMEREQ